MKRISILPYERKSGAGWLPLQYGKRKIRFVNELFEGTHTTCFKAINNNPKLRPVRGIEYALALYALLKGGKDWFNIQKVLILPIMQLLTRDFSGFLKTHSRRTRVFQAYWYKDQ